MENKSIEIMNNKIPVNPAPANCIKFCKRYVSAPSDASGIRRCEIRFCGLRTQKKQNSATF